MTQFDDMFDRSKDAPASCVLCETMLPEAVDGALTPEEQRAFDAHVAGCTHCAQELAEAQRGAAWLSMLKTKAPEPPVGLLERILAETSGTVVATAAMAEPVWSVPETPKTQGGWSRRWAETRMKLSEAFSFSNSQMLLQPRLAMTAAMAFFSLALTLNLMGVHVSDLHASSFTPSGIRRNLADAGASATRQIVNMRVVYQMESRVDELRGNGQQ